jgi:hypothetical protein
MGLQVFGTCGHENIVHIRKYCDAEKMDPVTLMDLCVVTAPEYKKIVSGVPSVCTFVCMCLSLVPEWLGRFLLLFSTLGFIHHWSVPGEYENSRYKISCP